MFKELIKKHNSRTENIRRFIAPVLLTLFFFVIYYLLGNRFAEVMGTITLILLVFLWLMLSLLMVKIGFMVLKSVFLVATEFSLLILLAQSYCNIPSHTPSGNAALSNLLNIGLLYIVITFGYSLRETLREIYKKVENEPWSKDKIGGVTLVLILVGLFVWQIYLVVNPIILNLCVYR